MATQAIKSTLGPARASGGYESQGSATAVGAAPSTAAVEAAVAVLLADGASPTQAHVNTLSAAWITLKALVDAVTTPPTGNLVVLYDDAVITDGNRFKSSLDGALQAARSRGLSIPG